MLLEVGGRREVRGGRHGVDAELLARRLDELAQRLVAGVTAPVLVGGDHGLGRAGPPGELRLGQPLAPSNVADHHGRIHPS